MTKGDFLASLRNELQSISSEEREEALKYYSEYFDDAGEGNEQNVIAELGSPERVANTIKANCAAVPAVIPDSKANAKRDNSPPNTSRTILIVLLVLLTFPLWVGIVGAAFGILISMIAIAFSLVAVGAGFLIMGVVAFFISIGTMAASPASAILTAGVALILAAVGLLMLALMIFALSKGVPAIGRGIGHIFKSLFKGGRK